MSFLLAYFRVQSPNSLLLGMKRHIKTDFVMGQLKNYSRPSLTWFLSKAVSGGYAFCFQAPTMLADSDPAVQAWGLAFAKRLAVTRGMLLKAILRPGTVCPKRCRSTRIFADPIFHFFTLPSHFTIGSSSKPKFWLTSGFGIFPWSREKIIAQAISPFSCHWFVAFDKWYRWGNPRWGTHSIAHSGYSKSTLTRPCDREILRILSPESSEGKVFFGE